MMIDFMDERKLTEKIETQEEFDKKPESIETETTVNLPIGLATRKRLPQRPCAIEALQVLHPQLTPKNLLNFLR